MAQPGSWGDASNGRSPVEQLNAIGAAHDRQIFAQIIALKENAESVAARTRKQLIEVAEALCPAWVDGLSETGRGIQSLSLEEIAQGIITNVRRRIGELEWRARTDITLDNQGEVEALRQERTLLIQENASLQSQVAMLSAQIHKQLEAPSVPPALPAMTPVGVAAPLEAGSTAAILLCLIVEGEGRAPVLKERLAEAQGFASTKSSSVPRAFAELLDIGLVEEAIAEDLRGKPHLIWPTDAGLLAYRALTGKSGSSLVVTLRKRHRTPSHTYLNIDTADLFRRLGCTVNLTPNEVRSDDGRFVPDMLVFTSDGEPFFIEVEMSASKQGMRERKRKWAVVARNTGGVIRVVSAAAAVLQSVRSETEHFAVEYGGKLDVAIGVYDEMVKKAQQDGAVFDDLWSYARVFNPDGGVA